MLVVLFELSIGTAINPVGLLIGSKQVTCANQPESVDEPVVKRNVIDPSALLL